MEATSILTLFAGIGVFLIACTMLSSNLESVCSTRLRNLFARASDKKLVGVGVGTVATAAIQSSGATTVLVIGFVNAGIMSLTLAAAVIYGANIGTTITAQIVAWGMSGGSSSLLTASFGAMAGVGAFVAAYAKKDRTKKIGMIVAAFGMLFVALQLMSNSMEDFAHEQAVIDFLSSMDNIVLLIIFGALLTALVQSSSVMTSVIIVMLMQGLITLDQGIYLTMGSNIGSCVVAIMAGFTSGVNARRTALIHLLFNVIGVVIFAIVAVILDASTHGEFTFAVLFKDMFPDVQIQLAMFHTLFNVITVLIMLPLTGYLIKVVMRIVPDKEVAPEEADAPRLFYVNDYMLKTPAIAVGEARREIENMASIALDNFNRACSMVSTLDMSEKDAFYKCEKQLNYTNKHLTHFLTKLSKCQLSGVDAAYVSTAFHTVSDLERIGDYAENIVEYAEKMIEGNMVFSDAAKAEIEAVRVAVNDLYVKVMEVYSTGDKELLKEAHVLEDRIDVLTDDMANKHIQRLSDGICTVGVGAEFLALSSDIERIGDHLYNVAKSIKELTKPYVSKKV